MKTRTILYFLFLVFIITGMNAYERGPVAVSPGSDTGVAIVGQSCPTFSWTAVSWATGYKVAVFEAVSTEVLTYEEMEAMVTPVLSEEIRGPALSWTPSADERLSNGGEYVWYVQAVDVSGIGVWSEGRMFKVEVAVRLAGIEEKVRERLREYGVDEEVITDVFEDVKSELKEVVLWGVDTQGSQGRMGIQGTEGADNTFYGLNAGASITTGGYNSFFGSHAGYNNTTANSNTFLGYYAGYNNTAGYNTFIGHYAGYNNTTGTYNSFMGYQAGYNNTTGGNNTFMGYQAGLYNIGSFNTFLGHYAGRSNTTGYSNTFLGRTAGRYNTTGYYNTFLGNLAGQDNTTGSGNAFMGYEAGYNNNTAGENIFIGYQAGYSNTIGDNNTFVGRQSGYSNTTGKYNMFIGYGAGYYSSSGWYNTFLGGGAGYANSIGYYNTFIGWGAGDANATGNGNVFLGYEAGANETGSDNKLFIDNSNTSSPLIYGEFDNDILAVNGKLGIGTQSPGATVEAEGTGSAVKLWIDRTDGATAEVVAKANNITFGSRSNHGIQFSVNSITRMHIDTNGDVGIGVTNATYPLELGGGAYCTGTNWVDVSSREYKENITDLNAAEAFEALEGLNPVRFNYKRNAEEDYVGFIAEDVPELVATKDRKGISTMDVVAVLTKVVQEQQRTDEEHKKLIQNQQRIIKELLERIEALEKDK